MAYPTQPPGNRDHQPILLLKTRTKRIRHRSLRPLWRRKRGRPAQVPRELDQGNWDKEIESRALSPGNHAAKRVVLAAALITAAMRTAL